MQTSHIIRNNVLNYSFKLFYSQFVHLYIRPDEGVLNVLRGDFDEQKNVISLAKKNPNKFK